MRNRRMSSRSGSHWLRHRNYRTVPKTVATTFTHKSMGEPECIQTMEENRRKSRNFTC